MYPASSSPLTAGSCAWSGLGHQCTQRSSSGVCRHCRRYVCYCYDIKTCSSTSSSCSVVHSRHAAMLRAALWLQPSQLCCWRETHWAHTHLPLALVSALQIINAFYQQLDAGAQQTVRQEAIGSLGQRVFGSVHSSAQAADLHRWHFQRSCWDHQSFAMAFIYGCAPSQTQLVHDFVLCAWGALASQQPCHNASQTWFVLLSSFLHGMLVVCCAVGPV